MGTTFRRLGARQTFEDNLRPAQLLLTVYRLLDCSDEILTEGELVDSMRQILHGADDEDLMLVYNDLFLGLVRERARIPRSTLRQATLCHLLRQAVVASCTALDAYLPELLRCYLPLVIKARGRDFVPTNDKLVKGYFQGLTFSLDETLRLLSDSAAVEYIANKVLGLSTFRYLSNENGVHVVAVLLGIAAPWEAIAASLGESEEELKRTLRDTVRRRNDIVHRADRDQKDPGGGIQPIVFSWTSRAVDTVGHICLAMDELVRDSMSQLGEMLPG